MKKFTTIAMVLLMATIASAQTKAEPTNIYVTSQGSSIRLNKVDTAFLMNHTTLSIRNSIMAVKDGGTIRNNEVADFIKVLLKAKKSK